MIRTTSIVLLGIFLSAICTAGADAQSTFNLNKNQVVNDWLLAADWTLASGPGPSPPVAGDTANTLAFLLRTPTTTSVFPAILNVNSGGTVLLKTTGTATFTDAHLLGGTLSQGIAPGSMGTFGGSISVDANSNIALNSAASDARTMILTATLSGSSALLVDGGNGAGTGTLQLKGNNSGYSGVITVRDAVNLQVFNNDALGSAAGGTVIGNSGTGNSALQLSGGLTFNSEPLTLQSTSASNRASLQSISGNNTFGGPITISGTGVTQMIADTGQTLNITGSVTRSGSDVYWRGGGTGNISGTVNLGTAAFIKTDTGTWNINSAGHTWGNTDVALGVVNLTMANALPTGTNVNMGQNDGGAATLNLNANSQTINNLTYNPGTGGNKLVTMTGGTFTVNGGVINNSGAANANLDVLGGTMTVANGLDVDNLRVGIDGRVGNLTVLSGPVDIGTGTNIVDIGRTNPANTPGTVGTADFSGASSVDIDVAELRIGTLPSGANPGSNARGTLLLSDSGANTINAATQILVGDSPGSGNSGTSLLSFGGATNTVNTPLLTIAGAKTNATADIAAGGTLGLSGTGGGRAELRIAYNNANTGAGVVGDMDLSGGTFNANLSTLTIGLHNNGAGSADGFLTFDAGTVNVNNVVVGQASAAAVNGSTTPQNTSGTIVQNGGSFVVNDSMTLGLNGATGAYTANGGSVSVGTGDAGDNLFIGRRTQDVGVSSVTVGSVSTMDLTGASSFAANVNTLGVGTAIGPTGGNTYPNGTLLLSPDNTITANQIVIADSVSVGLGGVANRIGLGASNIINADTFIVGGSKGVGLLDFIAPGSALTLNGKAGPGSRADLFIGEHNNAVATGSGADGTANFNGSAVNAMLDELVVGRKPNIATGATTGVLRFNSGNINTNSVQLGVRTDAGSAGSVTGTIHQSGGTMIVNNNMDVGAGGVGTYNLSDGTLGFNDTAPGTQDPTGRTASTLFINAGSAFNFTGGTLENVTTIDVTSSPAGAFVQDGGRFVLGVDGGLDPNDPLTQRAMTTIVGGDFLQNSGTLAVDIFGLATRGAFAGEFEGNPDPGLNPIDGFLTDSDLLYVEDGTATLDGTLAVNLNGVGALPWAWYDVVVADEILISDGKLDISGVGIWRIIQDPTDPTRQILQVAVPEPAALAVWSLMGLVGFGWLALRGRKRPACGSRDC